MKLTVTTTYIGRDGTVNDVKKYEQFLYFDTVVIPQARQTATIKEFENGLKITVTRLEPDKIDKY